MENKSEGNFLAEAIIEVGHEICQQAKSDDLINNILWGLYQKIYEDPNPLEQTAAEEVERD